MAEANTHVNLLKLIAPDLLVSAATALVVPVPGVILEDDEVTVAEVFDASNAAIFSIPAVIGTGT